jgi:FkbM family methyltransferase
MLVKLNNVLDKLNFDISGIIHIGAGSGAELRDYCKLGVNNFIMIEPDPTSYKKLYLRKLYYSFFYKKKINIENCLITDEKKFNVDFKIMNIKDCNSILDLHLHKKIYPNIFLKKTIKSKSETLNNMFERKYDIKNYNFINIDIQGAELLAFKGASNILDHIKGIYTEVNFEELYKNCALVEQLDLFLGKYNFKRVFTNNDMHSSWGDALYLKK